MQVHFKTIEGRAPNPGRDRRLAEVWKQFRELKDRATASSGSARPGPAAAQPGT